MLRWKIQVSNRAMQTVKTLKQPVPGEQIEEGEQQCVLIKLDNDTIGITMKDKDGYVEIALAVTTFQVNKGY